jgi:hypothetical protein
MMAPAVHSAPVEWRQMPQWQKWTGSGKLEMATVKESVDVRQWHVA